MNIPSLSMAMSQTKVQENFSVAMLSKSLDTNEAMGDGLIKMLDASAMALSVNPSVGSNIDISV